MTPEQNISWLRDWFRIFGRAEDEKAAHVLELCDAYEQLAGLVGAAFPDTETPA